MSAAARAAALGLRHVLLEKTDHLSDTIFRYQRGKHIMATPSQLVLRSDCSFAAGKRETVLETWSREAAKHSINVRYQADVKSITVTKGDFTITLTNGEAIKAKTVVLAIGTRAIRTCCAVTAPACRMFNISLTIRGSILTSIFS